MTDLFLGYPDEGIVNWIKENCVDYSMIPLCFEALEDTSIKLQIDDDSPVEIFLLYSFDNKNWNDWDYETGTDLKVGQKLYIKALHENECMSKYDSNTSNFYTALFTITNKVNISGNIMSLLYNDFVDKTEINVAYCLSGLFYGQPIIDASKLVINLTKINAQNSFNDMFNGCTYLKSVIKINCTDIVDVDNYDTFYAMFVGCSNIEIHYPKISESEIKHFTGAPYFGATNATVYYDL